jgi:tetraacyldisaccharide 4'-kinase
MLRQKSHDQRVKGVFRAVLYPLTILYGALTDARNALYQSGRWHAERAPVLTLSVGNLTVGGTGKTPHVEYLIRLLSARYALATLSRGYGRQTRGFRLADDTDTASSLGDEPLQLVQKFGRHVTVAVGEKRVDALRRLHERRPEVSVVLLDDAFQHRALQPDLNLLLTDYHRPFYEDVPFPAGRLRERRAGARRADAVVVTKSPESLTEPERAMIEAGIRRYARPEAPIFFSTLAYAPPVALAESSAPLPESLLLVSGLANADGFDAYARATFAVRGHRRFADHHAYTRADWERIGSEAQAAGARAVLTTEKDAVKLKSLLSPHELAERPVFYLPIAVTFLSEDGARFDRWILEQISRRLIDRSRHSVPTA